MEGVFVDNTCTGCHPAAAKDVDLDLSDATKAYATLVTDKTVVCDGKPLVTPGDPTKSFLIDVLGEAPGCNKDKMPPQGPISAAELKKVTDWIKGGALRDSDKGIVRPSALKSKDPAIGLDAGL